MNSIAFNIPFTCTESADNVKYLIDNPDLVNNGHFVSECKKWLEEQYEGYTAFMTTSGTRALELIALSINISEGNEIILSPFTYVGVGNAFANYGAKLIYADIDPQTMNINAELIEKKITGNTKAVIAMHYAGIPCELEKIRAICLQYNLLLIEDNAQGLHAHCKNKLLGSFGDYSCISFDILKNISCNEGGVLLCKNELANAVEVAYCNGTNRTDFIKGKVKNYEWVNKGSKFAMSEYTAAVLLPLLQKSESITKQRKEKWNFLFQKINQVEYLKKFIPAVMLNIEHNGHIAYLKFENEKQRNDVLNELNKSGISCSFHYIPLDVSIAGKKNQMNEDVCMHSLEESSRLLRLPVHNFLTENEMDKIVRVLCDAINSQRA